jgi:uncharacterized protein YodC (DUF2158 family)
MAEFKVGDIVQLLSGGPKMTVNHVPGEADFGRERPEYTCSWFAGAKLQHGRFDGEALKKVEPDAA